MTQKTDVPEGTYFVAGPTSYLSTNEWRKKTKPVNTNILIVDYTLW